MIRAVFVQLSPSVFIGLSQEMSFEMDTTVSLWQSFKPRVKEIRNRLVFLIFSISSLLILHQESVFQFHHQHQGLQGVFQEGI